MVYCGMPSKGCAHCRLRRIKCDRKDPACSQCRRASKECPGYRDELSLLFRDENEKTVMKSRIQRGTTIEGQLARRRNVCQRSEMLKKSNGSPDDVPFESYFSASSHYFNQTTPMPGIHDLLVGIDLDPASDIGINFFFAHYVTISEGAFAGQLGPPTRPLWKELHISRIFRDAVSSIGLAGLANVEDDKSLMILARRKYSDILQQVMVALDGTSEVDLLTTFRTVVLLAAFEICTSPRLDSWGIHINGAAALLRKIGLEAPKKAPTARMQLQFAFSVLIRYIQSGEKLPVSVIEMSQNARNSQSEKDSPAATLIGIITRFVDLYGSIKGGCITDPAAIFREALRFETELAHWEAGIPDCWNTKLCSLPSRKCDHGSNMSCNTYVDSWRARVTNHYRWARVLVNDILLGHIMQLGILATTEDLVQLQSSRETIVRLATDLCTIISAQTCQYSIEEGVLAFSLRMSVVFLQIWPLTVAGSAIGVPEELHNSVLRVLEKLGNTMGIRQALTVIPLIKLQREHWKRTIFGTPWVHHESFAEFSVLHREISTVDRPQSDL